MAHNPKTSTAARNAALDAALGSTTKLRIYSGSQPADADTALGAQVLLVDFPISWASAASGAKAASVTVVVATAAGTAAWGSFVTAGNVRVHDVTVGVGSGYDIDISDTAVVIGEVVTVSSAIVSMGA